MHESRTEQPGAVLFLEKVFMRPVRSEPRGVEVFNLNLIRDLAGEGIGILMISDDIPELMRTCDRIILMRQGKIAEEFQHDEIQEDQLNSAMVESAI